MVGAAAAACEATRGSVTRSVAGGSSVIQGPGVDTIVRGYNHDVPYGGRIFHVQTEDSGRARGHIFTHLFHGGTIVASSKVAYDPKAAGAQIVELAKQSHKAMMRRLVRGDLDHVIARCVGAPSPAPVLAPAERVPSEAANEAPAQARRVQALIESLDMDAVQATLDGLVAGAPGALGAALVDLESGMCLGTSGTGLDLDVAAAGIVEVMKAELRVMRSLGIEGGIEDVLITLESQLHVIRPVGTTCFLYLVLDRAEGNLALARHRLATAAGEVGM